MGMKGLKDFFHGRGRKSAECPFSIKRSGNDPGAEHELRGGAIVPLVGFIEEIDRRRHMRHRFFCLAVMAFLLISASAKAEVSVPADKAAAQQDTQTKA